MTSMNRHGFFSMLQNHEKCSIFEIFIDLRPPKSEGDESRSKTDHDRLRERRGYEEINS